MVAGATAVVMGASIGGLLAARVLSESFAEVVVVDRDPLPDRPADRRGVPQGRQLHVLLARGREAFEELFPGLSAELNALGAPLVDLHDQVHWYNDGYLMRRAPSDLVAIAMSRPLLEHVVRQRVAALAGVRLLPPVEVVGLATAPGRVTGVRLATGETIAADLVVDACGRASRTPVWLDELGYSRPAREQVRVDVTYMTRVYKREPHHLDGLLGALRNALPGAPRAAILAAQEDNTLAVAFSGMLGEQPPMDDESIVDFAGSLGAPQIEAALRSAVPVTDPARMRFPASVRNRYERLNRFPAGYLVFADALCSFNPIYGQGMTVAALEALLLRRLLTSGKAEARHFFRRAAKLIDGPWSIAVGTDLRFPEVQGPRSPKVRLVNAYVHRLHAAATADPVVGAAFLRVLNLIDPPTRLLSPRIIRRVLFGAKG